MMTSRTVCRLAAAFDWVRSVSLAQRNVVGLSVFLSCYTTLASIPAFAQHCDLNGKRIGYNVTSCVPAGCADAHQKIVILGDKVLLYHDITEDEGTVHYLGRSTNLQTDDLNKLWQSARDLPPGSTETATVRAERVGSDLLLETHRRLIAQSGAVIGNYYYKVGVRILSCNACNLLTFGISGDVRGRTITNRFEQKWCRVFSQP